MPLEEKEEESLRKAREWGRPSLAFFSPLRQSNPWPTQEGAKEADGSAYKAPAQRLGSLLTCNLKMHSKSTSLLGQ